jgi:hypothetical protein
MRKILLVSIILSLCNFINAENDSLFFSKVIQKVSDTALLTTTPENVLKYFNTLGSLTQESKTKSNCLFAMAKDTSTPLESFKVGFSKDYSQIRKGWVLEYVSVTFSKKSSYLSFPKGSKQIQQILGDKCKPNNAYGSPAISWAMKKYSADFFIEKSKNVEQIKLLIQIVSGGDSEE